MQKYQIVLQKDSYNHNHTVKKDNKKMEVLKRLKQKLIFRNNRKLKQKQMLSNGDDDSTSPKQYKVYYPRYVP